jgi:EAL domain-containing protein (putative c-di-GMP-specific phosphodiesterase class I)
MYSTEGIIAEGIETEKELRVVKDIGIYSVQGFLLGMPQELKRKDTHSITAG